MKRRIVHFEIGCQDIEKASEFYKTVFNWELERHGNSAVIKTEAEHSLSGHINQLGPEDLQRYITIYIETDSLEKDLRVIKEKGGEIIVAPVQLPDGRKFAWFQDISGNILGLITPK
ncbi:Glyoxalase/Bleomycin resistance protein/Dioxygenase superfamily protein [Robiginitalea myxolifaciens]|uniref:Glyoxalase/Bleomycin resistance protein/Dioxygenase superfamily protein n=1 Tax=Robiginitalea myxolifaciens TaxID=400055 RepID=A0A1I6HAX2_9FLAO|nr:VOC family protein [Robiginitalea myxolifaciens]SFR51558.1 Glyoxalase/Bleomycin resistance protein/Dioxygenase superfamily protein [Robiginitalea myxolifaciens]